jgi:hypothetical protein
MCIPSADIENIVLSSSNQDFDTRTKPFLEELSRKIFELSYAYFDVEDKEKGIFKDSCMPILRKENSLYSVFSGALEKTGILEKKSKRYFQEKSIALHNAGKGVKRRTVDFFFIDNEFDYYMELKTVLYRKIRSTPEFDKQSKDRIENVSKQIEMARQALQQNAGKSGTAREKICISAIVIQVEDGALDSLKNSFRKPDVFPLIKSPVLLCTWKLPSEICGEGFSKIKGDIAKAEKEGGYINPSPSQKTNIKYIAIAYQQA